MPERLSSRPAARAAMVFALLTMSRLVFATGADPPSDPGAASSSWPTPRAAPSTPRQGAALPASRSTLEEPITLDLGLQLGPSFRLDDAPAFAITERARLAFAARAFVSPSRRFSFGLAYEHVGLGREQGGDGAPGFVDVTRDLDALWAGLRLHVVSAPRAFLSVLVGAGLVFQHASVRAVLPQEAAPPLLIQCSGSEALNFAFRAGLGAEVEIGKGFSFLTDVLFDNVRLSSGALDDCVTGAGTTSLFSTRLGIAYKFDVSRFVR